MELIKRIVSKRLGNCWNVLEIVNFGAFTVQMRSKKSLEANFWDRKSIFNKKLIKIYYKLKIFLLFDVL